MRLLVYGHNFLREGAPIILFRLLRALRERHDIHVLKLKRPEEPLVEEYRALGIPLVDGVDLPGYDSLLVNTPALSSMVSYAGPHIPVLWWIHEPEMGLKFIARPDFDMTAFDLARLAQPNEPRL